MAVGAPTYASLPTMSSGDGITWTYSITLPSGSDQLLFVCASHDDGKSISSLSWNGSSPTAYLSGTAWGYWLAPATGSRTLAVVINAYSSRPPRIQVACFDGAHQTTPLGSVVTGSTPSSTPSTGSITCPSGGTVYGVLLHAFSTTDPSLTAGTGAGSPASAHSDSGWGYAHAYRESTGALSWSCSNSGSTYVAGVPINPAAGGGSSAGAAAYYFSQQ